jgi:hypothetical protein
VHARPRALQRERLADAPRATCDDGDFASQILHGSCISSVRYANAKARDNA